MRFTALAAGVAVSMAGLRAGTGAAPGEERREVPSARAVVSVRRIGSLALRGGNPRGILVETKRPGMILLEVDSPGGLYRAGFDGSTAWQTFPGRGSGRGMFLPESLARRIADLADIDGAAVRWRAEGFDVRSERLGREGELVRIEAAGPDGSQGVLLADARTGNAIEWGGNLGDGKARRPVEARFDAYVRVGGIDLPSCISIGAPGEAPSVVIELSKFEIDADIDDRWFSPPPVP